jgi:hypothetical protein
MLGINIKIIKISVCVLETVRSVSADGKINNPLTKHNYLSPSKIANTGSSQRAATSEDKSVTQLVITSYLTYLPGV